jgi:hypothetical protein
MSYCRCEQDAPYVRGWAGWDVWVADPARAWCRNCGLDVHPTDAKREYAKANAELERVEGMYPELTEGQLRRPRAPGGIRPLAGAEAGADRLDQLELL